MRAVPIIKFTQEEDNVPWLIDGLLPAVGWTLLVGKQGLGKSTFAMQLCAALQQGVPFMNRPVLQTSILFIQADSPTVEWRMMLKRIAPDSKGYTMVDVPAKCLSTPAYIDLMHDLISKVQPGFVVFDSLYNLTAHAINTESVLIPVNTMKSLVGNLPWLLIHHPPHGETRAAGHHSLAANCSNEWHLLRNKLTIEKGRLVKDKEILLSRDKDGLWCLKQGSNGAVSGDDDILNRPII